MNSYWGLWVDYYSEKRTLDREKRLKNINVKSKKETQEVNKSYHQFLHYINKMICKMILIARNHTNQLTITHTSKPMLLLVYNNTEDQVKHHLGWQSERKKQWKIIMAKANK